MTRKWQEWQGYQKAALVVAVIVALADAVIVYDLHLSGAWLSPSWLSWLKTTAFVLLFIGSLIAEMQDITRPVRLLLLAAVVLLGAYQAAVNVVVNYHAASIPASAVAFFAPRLDAVQVKLWYSVADGFVRTAVVVIMWLVTGLVWRGMATGDSATAAEVAELQGALEAVEANREAIRQEYGLLEKANAELKAQVSHLQAVTDSVTAFAAMPPEVQVRVIWECRNGDGLTKRELAGYYGVSESTIGRWIKKAD